MQNKVKRWENRLRNTIEDEKAFLFLICLFHLNVILRISLSTSFYKACLHYFPGLVFYVLLAMILHQISWRSLKKILEVLFIILSGAISITDVFLYVQYRDYLSFEKLSILLGTDPGTAKEFLFLYVCQPKVLILLVCAFLLFGKGLQTIHRMVISATVWHGIAIVMFISILSIMPILVVQGHKSYLITGLKPAIITEFIHSGIMPNLPEFATLSDIYKSGSL